MLTKTQPSWDVEINPHKDVTVDEYLDRVAGGWGKFQTRLSVMMGVNCAVIAMDNLAGVFIVDAILRGSSMHEISLVQQQAVKSWFYAGGLFGFLLSGPMADTVGRRPTLIAFSMLRFFSSSLGFVAPSVRLLIAARIVSGLGCAGTYNCLYTLICEYAPPSQRARVKRDLGLWWNVGVVMLVVGAWALQEHFRTDYWQKLAIIFVPSIATTAWLFCVPESPRFLNVNGRNAEALATLRAVAVENGTVLTASAKVGLLPAEADVIGCGVKFRFLLRGPQLRITLVLSILNFVSAGSYYGIVNAPQSATGSSNVFWDNLSATIVEAPAILLIPPLANCLGRRIAISVLLETCAMSLLWVALGSGLFFYVHEPWLARSRFWALLLARASGQAVGTLRWVLNVEGFPTSCRSTGTALVAFFGQMGGFLAPQAFGILHAPIVVFASIVAILPALVMLLPEMRGKELK